MRWSIGLALILGLAAGEARAETRLGFDVGTMFGKTESVVEIPQLGETPQAPRETAGGLVTRLGAVGEHYVVGAEASLWGATASVGSAALFGGVALRSPRRFAVELSGSLGVEDYSGFIEGGLYSDVATTSSVTLPFAAGRLQLWGPLGQSSFLGLFAEARTDLGSGTGAATVRERCGALCMVLGGMDDAKPVVHTFEVGGPAVFVGLNFRFTAKPVAHASDAAVVDAASGAYAP